MALFSSYPPWQRRWRLKAVNIVLAHAQNGNQGDDKHGAHVFLDFDAMVDGHFDRFPSRREDFQRLRRSIALVVPKNC